MNSSVVKPKKELGQNFLTDEETVNSMVEELDITPDEKIIEIGPGLGAVTKKLLTIINKSNSLSAIEFDPRLIENLKETTAELTNVEIINANVLDWLPKYKTDGSTKIIGSLPYYITSPIIHSVIYLENLPKTCIFLIQKEVGEKICSQIPETSYMSSFVQAFYAATYIATVEKEKFDPIPRVDGCVIKLEKKEKQAIRHSQKKEFEGFLHKAYANPRKMLNKAFSEEALNRVGIAPQNRPQNVSVDIWVKMFGSNLL